MLLDGQTLLSLYFQRTRNLRWWRRRQACLVSPSATWLWLRSSTWDSHSYRWSWWWWWGRWWWWWWWRRQCKGPPSSIFAANGVDDRDCCDHDILWSNADLWLREILKWMNKIIQNEKWKYLSLERVCFQWERSQHLEQFTRYFDFRLQEDRKCRKEQKFYSHHRSFLEHFQKVYHFIGSFSKNTIFVPTDLILQGWLRILITFFAAHKQSHY